VAQELIVTNPDDFKVLVRGAGVTVRWTGGDPALPVQISGSSIPVSADGTQGAVVSFLCLANAADGRFTVPASILSQLPASGSFSGAGLNLLLRGTFAVTAVGKGARFTAPGLDYLVVNNSWNWSVAAEYR
jgi:hypothetical protein